MGKLTKSMRRVEKRARRKNRLLKAAGKLKAPITKKTAEDLLDNFENAFNIADDPPKQQPDKQKNVNKNLRLLQNDAGVVITEEYLMRQIAKQKPKRRRSRKQKKKRKQSRQRAQQYQDQLASKTIHSLVAKIRKLEDTVPDLQIRKHVD